MAAANIARADVRMPTDLPIQIHVTLGPASSGPEAIQQLIEAGADVFRLNLSHCSPAELGCLVEATDSVRRNLARPVQIAADLRGRKLRLGPFQDDDVTLVAGQEYVLHPIDEGKELPGDAREAWVNYPRLADRLQPGAAILLDDGALRLRVEAIGRTNVVCRVEIGGPLPARSGLNLPGVPTDLPPLGPKDLRDLDAIAALPVDAVYLSHVESASDIHTLRQALEERRRPLPIIAKVERRLAVENLSAIVAAADAICLARGDLGVEVPLAAIPLIQRRAVAQTHAAGKPFILAGELFYSLVSRQTPARAELTDLFVALEQGVDGFILSDETAIGVAPVNAVRTLTSLIRDMPLHLQKLSLSNSSSVAASPHS